MRREFGNLDIYAGVNELEQSGMIWQPGWQPTPYLLYLSSEGQQRLAALAS